MGSGKNSDASGVTRKSLDSQMIAEADLRAIVRLLGQVAALPGGIFEKKTCLLDGLCDFTGAVEWRWALFSVLPDGLSCFASVRRRIGENRPPALALVDAASGFQEADLSACSSPYDLVFRRTQDQGTESHISLCREPRQKEFSSRETQLASLVLEEIPWLHWREWKTRQPLRRKLSPRLQWTMDLLLLGFGRKEIASQIGISEGTVSGYMRELYQQFGINSQAELMRIQLQKPPS